MAEITQAAQITALATRVGTECKTLHNKTGNLDQLQTTDKTSLVGAINEMKDQLGEGEASDIKYPNYGFTNVQDALDSLLYKAIVITSFSNTVNTVEMGQTIDAVTFNWSMNKTPKTLTFNGETIDVNSTSKALTDLSITANKSWSLKATDEKDAVSTKTSSITFLNGVYHGVGTVIEASGVTNEFIRGLTKTLASNKGKTFTVNAASGQYIYYAVPKRMGTVAFNVGGFDGGFTLLTIFSYTNASGYTEDYYVYKSDNASLGNTTVTAK